MTDSKAPSLRGLAFGSAAVLAWSAYNIGVAQGRAAGFSVADLTLLRYLGAAIALLPVALRRTQMGATTPGWSRIFMLLLFAGPHFGVLYNVGMPLTRLSHAVVISPGFSMIVAMVLASSATRQVPVASRMFGMGFLLAALLLIAVDHKDAGDAIAQPWRGDLIFVLTGTLYGTFTFLLGRWRGDAVLVTFWISALSLALVGPLYLAFATPTAHPASAWLVQFLLQGVLGGGWAIVLYVWSIQHLGAGRAAIFPALVPVVTTLLSIPITGVAPTQLEIVGSALAALGMYLSLKDRKRAT